MFKKILVPTDASEFSRHAFQNALEIARRFGAELVLLHVINTSQAYWGYTVSYVKPDTQEELELNGKQVLEETIMGIKLDNVQLTKKISLGHPVTQILDEANKENIDLIVMGCHGYGAIIGSMMGSVSQRVVQQALCPVLIVK